MTFSRPPDPGLFGQVEALQAVETTRSYQRAAALIGLSNASAVRKRIMALAKTIQSERLAVFDPASDEVRLTRDGEELLATALPLFHQVSERTKHRDHTHVTVRVGAFPAHVTNCLAAAANETRISYPDTRFDWQVLESNRSLGDSTLAEKLNAGELDVIVTPTRPPKSPRHRTFKLYDWVLCAVGHRLPAEMNPSALLQFPIGVSPEGHISRSALSKILTKAEIKKLNSSIVTQCASTEVLLALVKENLLIAVLPSDAIPSGWPTATITKSKTSRPGGTHYISCGSHAPTQVTHFVERAVASGTKMASPS